MTSIERTAYPQFTGLVTARELGALSPSSLEVVWAREHTRSDESLLALTWALKCFQRLGYFPKPDDVPVAVVDHLRHCLELPADTCATTESQRSGQRHRDFVRERLGVTTDHPRARAAAADAIRSAAAVKNNPADLINVALELLVKASLELPAYSTLDDMAATIRAEVNTAIFEGIVARMTPPDLVGLQALLDVTDPAGKSAFNGLKRAAGRASWSAFRKQVDHVEWVDGLGDTAVWLDGVAESKIADFAGEAAAADAGVMRGVAPSKRAALLASMVHVARTQARDDLAETFCKRVAALTKRARNDLEEIRTRQGEMSDRLIGHYRKVLVAIDPRSLDPGAGIDGGVALVLARETVEAAGGFDAELGDIDMVAAHRANNYMPLVAARFRRDRSTMFMFVRAVRLEATSADRKVLAAVEHAMAHQGQVRDWIPSHVEGVIVDLSFASAQWQRIILDPDHFERILRRPFEACVFTYLAEELRTGDIAVEGSQAYANWAEQLLAWTDCEPLLDEFCAEVGLPATAQEFTAQLRETLQAKAVEVDSGYPNNTDLVIDEAGRPTLKRRRGKDRTPSALALEEAIKQRMPERSLLDILARTAHWVQWTRHFGPASGSDPKLADPLPRYVLTTWTYGCNLGPTQAARHIRGVSAHELGSTAARHFTVDKLNRATVDMINAYVRLDVVGYWGDGTSAAADGTQIDTFSDNLLAESHIRYGGYGGIAYHHVANNYVALFSHFIPCGVWEAVYIVEGLLRNESDVQPDQIHADTQGQSYPVHALAHLFGFELLPRIRNWKDLIFYRPSAAAAYVHIDSLFGDTGHNTINWGLIESHWRDIMRVVLSIRDGRLSSTLLLRRLRTESHKNNFYKAFREVGRVMRTITLLRYISDPELREQVTAETNKVESYNEFADWLRFGKDIIERNDPAQMEKILKFNTLVANCVMFHTALDMMAAVRELVADGWAIDPDDLASVSPYITERVLRFGEYMTDGLTTPPEAFDPHLELAATGPASAA